MKGLDALAKACEPASEPATDNPAASLQLTDDMIDKIASRMIEKLQSTQQPEAENEEPQAEAPEDPGEEEEA